MEEVRTKLAKNFVPNIINMASVCKALVRLDQKDEAVKYLKNGLKNHLFKVAAAAGIYQGTALLYGVGAWDVNGSFSRESALLGNTSPISIQIAQGAVNIIPQELRATIASVSVPFEFGLSFLRMYVENKVYQKFGITPDPASTLLTPYAAGIIETAYKVASKYSLDESRILLTSAIGIYGNIIRMANAGILYAGLSALKRRSEKEQNSSNSQK